MIPAGKLYTQSVYIFVWHIESGCARCTYDVNVMQYLTYSNVKRKILILRRHFEWQERPRSTERKYSEVLPELTALMRSAGKLIRFRL